MSSTTDPTGGLVPPTSQHLAKQFDKSTVLEASQADADQHEQTVSEAFWQNRKAVFWSMALSAALIMEGYDVIVISSFYGQPTFLRRFGEPTTGNDVGYAIPAKWQSALSNGGSAGGILGLILNGWASERYGPKKVMLASLAWLTCTIFVLVFANSLSMLVAGEVLCGVPWGVFQTITTSYASEVCPIRLRGFLTAYINLCWGVGILLSSGVVKATINIGSDWSWRLPFVLQWMWIPFLATIVFLAPQSPWWLVRQERYEEAEHSVHRLTTPSPTQAQDAKNSIAMMIHTTALEREITSGASYLDCFRKTDRRRTEIVMMTFAIQQLSGQNLIGQAIQFLQSAGISTDLSFTLNMVINAMFIIGTFVCWGLLVGFGRRTLYIVGLAVMWVCLLCIGGLSFVDTKSSNLAIGSLLIALNFFYNATLGPVCYVIIGETSSTRLRQKSVALSRMAYQVMNIVCNTINPKMLSPLAWNWGAKSAFFWAGTCGFSLLYCILRLPETKNRSYGELDLLFEHKVPAWRFKTTKVNQFELPEGTDLTGGLDVDKADKRTTEVENIEYAR